MPFNVMLSVQSYVCTVNKKLLNLSKRIRERIKTDVQLGTKPVTDVRPRSLPYHSSLDSSLVNKDCVTMIVLSDEILKLLYIITKLINHANKQKSLCGY